MRGMVNFELSHLVPLKTVGGQLGASNEAARWSAYEGGGLGARERTALPRE